MPPLETRGSLRRPLRPTALTATSEHRSAVVHRGGDRAALAWAVLEAAAAIVYSGSVCHKSDAAEIASNAVAQQLGAQRNRTAVSQPHQCPSASAISAPDRGGGAGLRWAPLPFPCPANHADGITARAPVARSQRRCLGLTVSPLTSSLCAPCQSPSSSCAWLVSWYMAEDSCVHPVAS